MKHAKYALLLSFSLAFLFLCCSNETYKEGKLLYMHHCSSCHGEQMQGLGLLYPALNNPAFLKKPKDQLPCFIRTGSSTVDSSAIKDKSLVMPTMPSFEHLDAIEINNILNYINANHWHQEIFHLPNTMKLLESCPTSQK